MGYSPSSEQIEVAVNWWKKAIKSPAYKTLRPEDRQREPEAAMAELVAGMNRPIKSEKEIDLFGESLDRLLSMIGDQPFSYPHVVILDVDYQPGHLLAIAAEAAGLGTGMLDFPWKTTMWLSDDGHVTVRAGYGADEEQLP